MKLLKRILYLGWVNFGNLGDDVCRDLFRCEIQKRLKNRGIQANILSASASKAFDGEALLKYRPDIVVLGGGSVLVPSYASLLIAAKKNDIPVMIWGSGIDRLTEDELDLIRAGNHPKSFNHYGQFNDVRTAVTLCNRVGVRGPHTRRILESLGCDPRKVDIIGDPGLLLKERDLGDISAATAWFRENPRVIGVNWGTSRNNVMGLSEHQTEFRLLKALTYLSDHYALFFYAVWRKDLEPLKQLASKMQNRNIFVADTVYRGRSLAFLQRQCVATINFKLHANIFSAAVGCPFISLAYRSKCYDFGASLNCDDLVVPFNDPQLDRTILNAMEKITDDSSPYLKRIMDHKEDYCRQLRTAIDQYIIYLS